jgi:hypothetical protein
MTDPNKFYSNLLRATELKTEYLGVSLLGQGGSDVNQYNVVTTL